MQRLAIFTLAFLPVCALATDMYGPFYNRAPIDYSVPYLSTEHGEAYRARVAIERMREEAETNRMLEDQAERYREIERRFERMERR